MINVLTQVRWKTLFNSLITKILIWKYYQNYCIKHIDSKTINKIFLIEIKFRNCKEVKAIKDEVLKTSLL